MWVRPRLTTLIRWPRFKPTLLIKRHVSLLYLLRRYVLLRLLFIVPVTYNTNRPYTPSVRPIGPLSNTARSPGFTVLPRTPRHPCQSRSHAPYVIAGPSLSALEDQLATPSLILGQIPLFDPGIFVFNPDHAISTTLLTRLASAISATIQQLFDPGIFVFDPDHAISTTLLTRLASAISATLQLLCQPLLQVHVD